MLFSYKIDPTDKSSSNTMGQAQPTLLWAVVISSMAGITPRRPLDRGQHWVTKEGSTRARGRVSAEVK